MPRRYGADGTRLWNGKTPEEFTEADAYRFMAETEAVLQRKELMDDPAQPAPASGKEEFYLSKKDDVLLTPEQIAAEERRWLFDAPIAELAEVKGVSIDEAVKMRTDAVLQEAVVPITVSVRPIEPQGKLIGFASVNFGGVVIDDFKVVDGKNGIFLGAPSKPDSASRTGYRATVRIPDRHTGTDQCGWCGGVSCGGGTACCTGPGGTACPDQGADGRGCKAGGKRKRCPACACQDKGGP